MIKRIYKKLIKTYGPQGWWPVQRKAGKKGYDARGYHKGDCLSPKGFPDKFEIILGAILTQNTSWKNVEIALGNLIRQDLTDPRKMLEYPESELAQCIKSSGYFNQKARKLKAVSRFLIEKRLLSGKKAPGRRELLAIWGVGPETADSILLYAYHIPVFVIDAYTRRLFSRMQLINKDAAYPEMQNFFHTQLTGDPVLFNEYHALIVRHAKEHCRAKPVCRLCPIAPHCSFPGRQNTRS